MKIKIALPAVNNHTNALSIEVEPSDLVVNVKTQIYQLLNQNIAFDDAHKKRPRLARKLTKQLTTQPTTTRQAAKSQQIMHYNDTSDDEPLNNPDNPRFSTKATVIGSSAESLQLFYKVRTLDNDKTLQDYDVNELSVLYLQPEKKREKVRYLNI